MKKQSVLISFLVLIIFSIQIYSQTASSKMSDQEELEIILEKSAEYCERLENVSLYFVCREEIIEKILRSGTRARGTSGGWGGSNGWRNSALPPVVRNKYIYDYQLLKKGNSKIEQRNLLKENGQERNDLDVPLKTKRFRHKFIVFGPKGLLGREQQKNYDYKILKEVNYKKEKAVVLEAVPKFQQKYNAIYGNIWIRKKDFAILKIEWEQESIENYDEIEKTAEGLNALPSIIFISEYGFEKNKIRFPNKYSVKELYVRVGMRLTLSTTTVIYDNYKFFIVDTKVKY